jgi:hypothetical protein
MVRSRQGQGILANRDDYGLEVAKQFLKRQVADSVHPDVQQLRRELIAARLNISCAILDANPGFQDFAKHSHLYRYLARHGHGLKVDAETLQIYVLHQKSYLSWEELKPRIEWDENGVWKGYYGKDGLRFYSVFDWEKLEPFASDDPSLWGNCYVIEAVVWTAEDPSLTGKASKVSQAPQWTNTHTFLRIRTNDPEDNVYSIGLTRPQKFHWKQHFDAPLAVRQGDLMSPDMTEYWGGHKTVIPMEISPEKARYLIGLFEQWKRDGLPYRLKDLNCNELVLKAFRFCGADMNSFMPLRHLLLPREWADWTDRALAQLPSPLRRGMCATGSLLVNSVSLLFGSGSVHRSVAELADRNLQPLIGAGLEAVDGMDAWWRADQAVVRFFQSSSIIFTDLVNAEHTRISHPWFLGECIREEVELWRVDEQARMDAQIALFRELLESPESFGLDKTEKRHLLEQLRLLQLRYQRTERAVPEWFRLDCKQNREGQPPQRLALGLTVDDEDVD